MTKENTERFVSNEDLEWRERAACTGKQALFFSDFKSSVVKEAKAICGTCVVQSQCLAHAMKHQEFGIWGGLTANERRMKRRMQRRELRLVE